MSLDLTVKVHPTVLFQVVDAYERRTQDKARIIGTLLGTYEKNGVEVTNCFCVPHAETQEELFIKMDFASEMYELHQQVAPQETMVGWFATGPEVTDHSVLIHTYYSKQAKCPTPIHLTLDTVMAAGRMSWKAYISNPMGVPGGTGGTMFSPVPVELVAHSAELVGINIAQNTKYSKTKTFEPTTDLSQFTGAVKNIEDMVDNVAAYVDSVLAGKTEPDATVGRQLLDMVHSVPKMSQEQFDEMLNSNIKDLLMVVYLSQLTKTQIQVSEKLSQLKL